MLQAGASRDVEERKIDQRPYLSITEVRFENVYMPCNLELDVKSSIFGNTDLHLDKRLIVAMSPLAVPGLHSQRTVSSNQ